VDESARDDLAELLSALEEEVATAPRLAAA
jgi:hypothetical protein